VSGAVALELRDVAEQAAADATAEGRPAIACAGGDEPACAREFIDRFASRAFQGPIDDETRGSLLGLYDVGTQTYGGHAGGIRVVIEGVLQAPSFLYLRELGTTDGSGRVRLTPYEVANKLSLFLRDALPDDALWAAAESGELMTEAGLQAEAERLLAQPEVQSNVTAMFRRLFQLDRIHEISKAPTITDFTPELIESMVRETDRFLDETIWNGPGTLSALLTSRTSYVDERMAQHYGLPHPGGDALVEVELPEGERAGILTQPSVMTIEALPDQSSVVHRGVFIARELLCFHPPAPMASDLMQGQAFKDQEPTERGRAGLRAMNTRCRGCHGFFDPIGLAFEHYDTLGRFRTEIATPEGAVPVDATSELNIADVSGPIDGAVELADLLAGSDSVRACMARQLASYAFGARIADEQACTVEPLVEAFEQSGGELRALVQAVTSWEGLQWRSPGEQP